MAEILVRCVSAFCGLALSSVIFCFSPLQTLWHVLTPSCFLYLPSSPDSSGHLQSHPTLPIITSSILLTVGAPELNSPLCLTNPHFSSVFQELCVPQLQSFFLFFVFFCIYCGCSELSLNVRWNDVDFQAVWSCFRRKSHDASCPFFQCNFCCWISQSRTIVHAQARVRTHARTLGAGHVW